MTDDWFGFGILVAALVFLVLLFVGWNSCRTDFVEKCRAAGGVPVTSSHNGYHCYTDGSHIDVEKRK